MKIGIFGGSFNPVHQGHFNAALKFQDELSLDKVLIVPSNIPPHKDLQDKVSAADRVNMLKILFDGIGGFEVSDIEINRPGKSYSIDTVRELRKKYKNDEFYLYCGTDMILTFDSWYKFRDILKECTLVCGLRNKKDYNIVKSKCEELSEKYKAYTYILKNRIIEISSTDIRNAIINNINIDKYLNADVYQYIKKNFLYIDFDYYINLIRERLSENRYLHSLSVAKKAVELAEIYKFNVNKAKLCGLLHDITKELTLDEHLTLCDEFGIILEKSLLKSPQIIHAVTGSIYVKKKLNIESTEIINAIRYHATGKSNMTVLEKIIYIADMIEERRKIFRGLSDIRTAADENIDKAMEIALKITIDFNKNKGNDIYKDTLEAYEFYKNLNKGDAVF